MNKNNNYSAKHMGDAQVSVTGIPTVKKLSEAASYFGLSDYTVRRWVNGGSFRVLGLDEKYISTLRRCLCSYGGAAFKMRLRLQRPSIQLMYPKKAPRASKCPRFFDGRQCYYER